MPEPKQQFLCCTRKQISILRCPQCKHLLGYCRICFTLFRDLQDLSSTMVKNSEAAIECSSCHYNYPAVGWEKHLAVRRDLVEIGLAALASEDLQLSAVAREDDPMEKYRHSLNRIGWSGGSHSNVDFTDESKDKADKAARKRLTVLLLLLLVCLLGAGVYYYLFLDTPPPPPPPLKKPVTKPVKR
jgi:hypothetical protein